MSPPPPPPPVRDTLLRISQPVVSRFKHSITSAWSSRNTESSTSQTIHPPSTNDQIQSTSQSNNIKSSTMAPKIAVVYYTMYGHIRALADAEVQGLKKAGADVTLLRVPETLSREVLDKMHAPPTDESVTAIEDPADLLKYDGFLLGIPTRYGNFPGQWKAFWDKTGQLWVRQALRGKMAGLFISNATLGGGQESTPLATMSTFAHHGIIFVPFGTGVPEIQNDISEVRGGSAWGAGTFTGADGSRMPSEKELALARAQGEYFGDVLKRYQAPKSS